MSNTFSNLLIHHLSLAKNHPGPDVGQLLFLDSKPLRRLLRSVSSARTSITDSTWLILGLAYLQPQRFMQSLPQQSESARQHFRLSRTFANDQDRLLWCTIQATRSMAALEIAATLCDYQVEWVLEGIDRQKIASLLAIPDDHQILGFLAIHQPTNSSSGTLPFPSLAGLHYNGFGGNWPIDPHHSGPQHR